MPAAVRFAGDFMRPLADKIDAISYTEQLRNQRVAKEYAVRVLRKAGKGEGAAAAIAERLVTTYPSHRFVIGYEEAAEFLDLAKPNDQQQDALDRLCEVIWQGTDVMIGRRVPADEQEPAQSDISASG